MEAKFTVCIFKLIVEKVRIQYLIEKEERPF